MAKEHNLVDKTMKKRKVMDEEIKVKTLQAEAALRAERYLRERFDPDASERNEREAKRQRALEKVKAAAEELDRLLSEQETAIRRQVSALQSLGLLSPMFAGV